MRRSARQSAGFRLAQAIHALALGDATRSSITAGVRFSDLFTDVSYILAVPTLTWLGWALLVPPPALNLVGVVIMLLGYRQATRAATASPQR